MDKNSTENFIDKDHLHPDDLFFLQKILFIQKKQSHICSAGFQMLTVFPNGDIYPCQLLHKDSYKIGNIETLDKDIKNYIEISEKNNYEYKKEFNTCSECIARNICKMCLSNKILSGKDNLCSEIRKNMLENLNKIVSKGILDNISNLL